MGVVLGSQVLLPRGAASQLKGPLGLGEGRMLCSASILVTADMAPPCTCHCTHHLIQNTLKTVCCYLLWYGDE